MTTVIISAEFAGIAPAHKRFITKQGVGSNLDRAVRDAVTRIFKDDRLKGRRASILLPCKMIVQTGEGGE